MLSFVGQARRELFGLTRREHSGDPVSDRQHQVEHGSRDRYRQLDPPAKDGIRLRLGHLVGECRESPLPTLAAVSEEGSCPACGGALARWRTVESAEPALRGQAFTLLRCGSCGSAVTLEPAPSDAHESGAYGSGPPRLARLAAPILDAFDRRRLTLLSPMVVPPATLLDAGAGRGRFVAAARHRGFEALGLEPSARGVETALALGVPVLAADISTADLAAGSFDAITLWHVLEHLDEPGAALDRMRGWLRPGGALLVGVPNLASWQARLGGRRWFHLDVPRHRVHFTARGLDALLRAHGFVPISEHHVLLEHNPFGMWQSLVSRLTHRPSYLYNLLKRNAPAASADLAVTLVALPLAPVAALVELFAGLAGRGGTLAVLARAGEYD